MNEEPDAPRLDIRFVCDVCGIRQQVTEHDLDIFSIFASAGEGESHGSHGIIIVCPNNNCEGMLRYVIEEW